MGRAVGLAILMPVDEPIQVECYAGSRGKETPRRLWVGDRWEELTVLDRWVGEAVEGGARFRWFRVRLGGEKEALICYDERLDAWFCRSPSPEAAS